MQEEAAGVRGGGRERVEAGQQAGQPGLQRCQPARGAANSHAHHVHPARQHSGHLGP